jgi:PilZ domain
LSRYIENLRRSPRVPTRCTVALTRRGDGCKAETEDIGPGGCLVVTPLPLQLGEPVMLHIESEQVAQPLRVRGRVAWVGGGDHLRAGISFTDERLASRSDPASWFQALCEAEPRIAARLADVPERIAYDAPLYLRPPPTFIVDFTPEELAVLGTLDTGITVEEVLAHPDAGPHADRVIFALLARRAITLAPMDAVPAWQWRPVLERALGRPLGPPRRAPPLPPPPRAPAVAAAAAARPDILPAAGATPGSSAPPLAAAPPQRAVPAPSAPQPHAATHEGAAPATAGAPPRRASTLIMPSPGAPPRLRLREAQECFDQAKAAVEANDLQAAIALLRRALTLAPGDPEIATLLGQMAFKDRQV